MEPRAVGEPERRDDQGVANFVQEASAVATPWATGDDASQKPQISATGMIASFVFAISVYAVNG